MHLLQNNQQYLVESKISPKIGERLEGIVDKNLRNAIAHGTFWFEKGKVFLAKNSYLEEVKEIPLHEFWIAVKKQNIVALAFVYVLIKRSKEDYFKG